MALMIGVSGVRGLVGETLTPTLVLEFAQAYASLLGGGRLVLARDSRPSGQMYASAVAAGLLAGGSEVTDIGIAMTPTVAHAIRTGRYSGGVNITASHNPGQWNGLKFLDDEGLAPDPARAAQINELRERRAFRLIKSDFKPLRYASDAAPRHARAVLDALEVDPRSARVKVVLDCVNGAGGIGTPDFLRELGCNVVGLNAEPNGLFAHAPEPLEENLRELCAAVKSHGASLGFAQDPDADRLALVDETGRFIGEEYTLALATWSVLSRRPGTVAANLSTSRMVDDIAARFGSRVVRTPVGEAHVARALRDHGGAIGGEGNGGVIDPRISLVRDSLSAMSLVLQLMAREDKTVSQLVAGLPRYVIIKQKFECPRARIEKAVDSVRHGFPGVPQNASDGVRLDWPEGWVHLRASNTEPIVRIIAEARDAAAAESLIQRVRAAAGF